MPTSLVGVLYRVFVALRADGDCDLPRYEGVATDEILTVSHGFKMVRADAGTTCASLADMVEFVAVRNRADKQFPSDSMCVAGLPSPYPEAAIAVAVGSSPKEPARLGLFNLGPESLG